MEVDKQLVISGENLGRKKKVLEHMEDDRMFKELLINTSRMFEVEDKNNKISA